MMKKRVINIRTKLPEVRENIVIRPSLSQKIQLIQTNKLMVLEAGAGSGKTTAAASFLRSLNEAQVKWLRMGTDCNHLLVFWSYLVEVLQDNLGDFKQEFLDFFQASATQQNIEEVLAFFTNSIDQDQEIFLVLDDFHLITNQVVIDSFALFLEEIPYSVHVLLLTRFTPKLYLGKWEMENQLVYLHEKDFLLTPNEAQEFIENTLAINLSAEQLGQLTQIANGWVGGLQLLAASKDWTDFTNLTELQENEGILADYLDKEIFQQLTSEEQAFLVKTAYFMHVDKNLSTTLLPAVDFEKIMVQLIHKNLMIECLDRQQQIYRYHPILTAFLVNLFEKMSPEEKRLLKRKAADVYLEVGEFDGALQLYLELGEYQVVMNAIIQHPQTLRSLFYLGQVPVDIASDNIDFAYQKIFYHYSNFEYDICREIMNCLEEKYPNDLEINAIQGLRILLDLDIYTIEQTPLNIAEIKRLNLNDLSKAIILVKNAAILYFHDQYWQAIDFIQASQQLNTSNGNSILAYFIQMLLAQTYEEIGEFNRGLALLEDIKKPNHLQNFNDTMRNNYLTTFYVTITGIYLKRRELDQAEAALQKVQVKKHQHVQPAYLYNEAEYLYLADQPEKAFEILQELENPLTGYSNPFVKVGLLKYALFRNQLSEAYLDSFIASYYAQTDYKNLSNQLFYAMILFKRQQKPQALEVVEKVLLISRKNKVFLKIVEANLLKLAILLEDDIAFQEERLLKNLYNESLYYASENQIRGPFYFYKEVVKVLDQQFGAALVKDSGVREQAFHQDLLAICLDSADILLTTREQEVLVKLSEGVTNKEIASSLFISEATVKTHILNIYRKLEVNSRIKAVEKGRRMKII